MSIPADLVARIVAQHAPQPVAVEGPSWVRMGWNLAGDLATHVAAGMPRATAEQTAARLAVCRSGRCGFYAADRCLPPTCGCPLETVPLLGEPGRATMAALACPVGLWREVDAVTPLAPAPPRG